MDCYLFFFRKPIEFIEYLDQLKYRPKYLNSSRILQLSCLRVY